MAREEIDILRANIGDPNRRLYNDAELAQILEECGGNILEATRVGLWTKMTKLSDFDADGSGIPHDEAVAQHLAARRQYQSWIEYMRNRPPEDGGTGIVVKKFTYSRPSPAPEYG